MKGRIMGFKEVDYPSKRTGKQIKGITLIIAITSGDVFGERAHEEFISAKSPLFRKHFIDVFEDIDKAVNSLIGAEIVIDYDVQKRGKDTFTTITDILINPVKAAA